MRPHCECFDPLHSGKKWHELQVHHEAQDRQCSAWIMLLDLIDDAARDKRSEFIPRDSFNAADWMKIVTLPPEISRLKHVKRFVLYGSNVTWIPPQIGEMESLEEFIPYTSYRLHWLPYELTRCTRLKKIIISRRALYGNINGFKPPFPSLRENPVELYGDGVCCSVCGAPAKTQRLNQLWVSHQIAIDVIPYLVNVCSKACKDKLPHPPEPYLPVPHKGGIGLSMPHRPKLRLMTFGWRRKDF